ncbi:MAG: 2-oxoacid:acceptor oxidoreductase subunit alpha [Calditerrivibrio sp.]|nr:2-oxoacid:acceptor oxidoreductase subunit alpha [Calditerrivibrio sp.]MCA1931971.1 2-oxoacid:acceptor oxidoreductase subunit alpha [Calditerrivibrio sp.]
MFGIKIGGPAGLGIMSSGLMLLKLFKRSGYYVHGYPEYPSLIRGGYNSFLIEADKRFINAPFSSYNILVALADVAIQKEKITEEMFVILDIENSKEIEKIKGKVVNVPFKSIVKSLEANEVVKNSIAMGSLIKLMGIDFKVLESLLREFYPSEKLFNINLRGAELGYHAVNETLFKVDHFEDLTENIVLTGNEAISMGAIAAGVNFFATYPMTPASSILHFLAEEERRYNIITKHTEDEISAINMAIGASFAGARSMVATAGGGFSLMVEGLGLAAIAETPIVIVESQRPGPATGMPTWTEQSDLKFILNASQDEFVRIVFTPGDVDELFYYTFEAFNLAERYHVPVFVMSDKFLSESYFSTKRFDTSELSIDRGFLFDGDPEKTMEFYPRYKEVEKGIGCRTFPGVPGGLYKASGNEHDQFGFVTDDGENRVMQQDRRFKKIDFIKNDLPIPKLYGNSDAELTVVCWGSLKGQMMEIIKDTEMVNFIHFSAIHPIDWYKVKGMLEGKDLVLVENNKTGQLGDIIAEHTGILISKRLLKYDGRPFFIEELREKLLGGII